jgi:hypothetical protein
MPVTIPPAFALCSIFWSREGDADEMAITYGVDATESTDINEVASYQNTCFMDAYAAGDISNTMRITRVTARVGQDGGEPLFLESSSTFVGSNAGTICPQNVAILVRKRTNRGGRRGRGRFFLPWCFEASVDNAGRLTSGEIGATNLRMSNFLDALANPPIGSEGGPTPMVLLHSTGGSSVAGAPTPVTGLETQSLVATQRRRLRR